MRESGPGRQWIVQPLLEAGMEPEDVATLLFRVGFEGLVAGGRCDVSDLTAFVRHPSSALRAAWIVTVDRMLHADDDLIAVSSP